MLPFTCLYSSEYMYYKRTLYSKLQPSPTNVSKYFDSLGELYSFRIWWEFQEFQGHFESVKIQCGRINSIIIIVWIVNFKARAVRRNTGR